MVGHRRRLADGIAGVSRRLENMTDDLQRTQAKSTEASHTYIYIYIIRSHIGSFCPCGAHTIFLQRFDSLDVRILKIDHCLSTLEREQTKLKLHCLPR